MRKYDTPRKYGIVRPIQYSQFNTAVEDMKHPSRHFFPTWDYINTFLLLLVSGRPKFQHKRQRSASHHALNICTRRYPNSFRFNFKTMSVQRHSCSNFNIYYASENYWKRNRNISFQRKSWKRPSPQPNFQVFKFFSYGRLN